MSANDPKQTSQSTDPSVNRRGDGSVGRSALAVRDKGVELEGLEAAYRHAIGSRAARFKRTGMGKLNCVIDVWTV